MPLINCKIHLELNWIEDHILSNVGNSAKFKITEAKLHLPIVTLSKKDNINLTKQLSDGFKRVIFSYFVHHFMVLKYYFSLPMPLLQLL